MAVTTTTRIAGPFTGNGVAIVFPFAFTMINAADLFLLVADLDGNLSELVQGTDYTAVLNSNQDNSPGGVATMSYPLQTGWTLVITSVVAQLQQVVLANLGAFLPTVLNGTFDQLTILIQQLQQGVDQSLKFGLTDDLTSTALPAASQRANMFLGFDANGAAIATPTSPTGPVGPAGQPGPATPGTFTAGGALSAKQVNGEQIASQYASFTFTATTATGSMALSGVSSTANLATGQLVAGTNIAPSTVIVMTAGVASLSLPAIGNGAGTLTVTGGPSATGFTNALTAAGASGKVTLDLPYGIATPPEANNLGMRSQVYQKGQAITDRSPGADREYYYSSDANEVIAAKLLQHFHAINTPASQGVSSSRSFALMTGAHAPGTMTEGAETVCQSFARWMYVTQKGIHQEEIVAAVKASVGDWGLKYLYASFYGGTVNGDDETAVVSASYFQEGNNNAGQIVPQALVTAVGTASDGVAFLRLNPTQLIGEFGGGRYALLVNHADGSDAAIATLTVTGQAITSTAGYSFAAVTVAETLSGSQISAIWATGNTPYDVPYNFDLAQPITTTVTIGGGSAAATGFVAGIASMVGTWRKEYIDITSVHAVAGGQQQITFLVRQTIDGHNGKYGSGGVPAGAPQFYQDAGGTASGLIQSVIKLASYGAGKNSQAFPIYGAIDAHTLIVGTTCHGSEQGILNLSVLQPVVDTVALTRDSSGNVTIVFTGGSLQQSQCAAGMIFSIAAVDTTYNITNASLIYSVFDALSYVSATHTAGSTTGTITFNAGKNTGVVYRGCEVIRTLDPDVVPTPGATDVVGNYIGLESNNISWPVSCKVESPSHYAVGIFGPHINLSAATPVYTGAGITIELVGEAARAGLATAACLLVNENPASDYAALGGFHPAPAAVQARGVFGPVIDAGGWVPQAGGQMIRGPFMNRGDDSGHVVWDFLGVPTNTSNFRFTVDQSQDIVGLSFGSLGLVFDVLNGVLRLNGPGLFNTTPRAPAYGVSPQGTITAAATITPTASIFHLTGTTPVSTINLSTLFPNGSAGVAYIIPASATPFTTGGNIPTAFTAVAGVPVTCVFDGSNCYLK